MKRAMPILLMLLLIGCKKEQPAPAAGESAGEAKAAQEQTAAAKPQEQAKEQAGGTKAVNPMQAMAQLAKAGAELSKKMGGNKQMGPVVNWRALAPFVPDKVGEFAADGDLDGATNGMGGMQVSRVKRLYKSGDAKLRLTISDTSMVPMLRAGFAMAAQIQEDSTRGVKKGVKVEGNPGVLEWRKARKRAKLALLVGGRYLVELRLRPAEDADAVMKLAKQLDVAKLAQLKAKAPEKK